MRSSAALRGLRSLASKLHPQSPLTAKESAQLLNALTSSFRQQLDDAHPQSADKVGVERSDDGSMRIPRPAALDADEHLAALLTSPLLAVGSVKRPRELATSEDVVTKARTELARSPGLEPIAVLESYIEKGTATVALAVLCLQNFKNRLLTTPETARATIRASGAGRRVLSWLWKSEQLESPAFTGNNAILNLLPYFLLREKMDMYLWALLEHHLETDVQSDVAEPLRMSSSPDQQQRAWRGRLLRGMVLTRFEPPHFPNDVSHALHTFFKAHDTSNLASHRTRRDLLGPAGAGLCAYLTNKTRRTASVHVKVDQYNKFIGLIDSWASPAQGKLERAKLLLYHPSRPDAMPMYSLFREAAQPGNIGAVDERLRNHLLQPRTAVQRTSVHNLLTQMFLVLEKDGYYEEAAGLDAIVKSASLAPALKRTQRHVTTDAGEDCVPEGRESTGVLTRLAPLRYVT